MGDRGRDAPAPPRDALVAVLELVAEPVEALVEAVTRGGARRLDVPVAVAQRVQAQLVRHLSRVHRIREILNSQC